MRTATRIFITRVFQRKQHVCESILTFAAAFEALLQAADPSVINCLAILGNFITWPDLLRKLDRSIPRVEATEAKLLLIKAEAFEVNWLATQTSHNNRPSYPRSKH